MGAVIGHWYRVTKQDVIDKFGSLLVALQRVTVYPRTYGNDEPPAPMRLYHVTENYVYFPRRWGEDNFGRDVPRITTMPQRLETPYPKCPTPREGQAQFFSDILSAVKTHKMFMVKAQTGTGKTVAAMHTLAKMQVSALVIAPTDALIRQWEKECIDKLGLTKAQIGIVKQDKCIYEGKHVTIASLKSLYSRQYPPEFYKHFGMVVYDELQTLNASEMSGVLGKFYANVQIGFTATPDKRKDGRDEVSFLWFGRPTVIAYGVNPVPVTIRPFIIRHNHGIDSPSRNTVISVLGQNKERTKKITALVHNLYNRGRVVLGISDNVRQLQYAAQLVIDEFGVPEKQVGLFVGETYTGNTKMIIQKNNRFDIGAFQQYASEIETRFGVRVSANMGKFTVIGDLSKPLQDRILTYLAVVTQTQLADIVTATSSKPEKSKVGKEYVDYILGDKDIKIYFATYGVMAMGVDVPWLDTGVDYTPRSETEQVLGRIRRQYEGKKMAYWYTPMDVGFSGVLNGINKSKMKGYAALSGITIERTR